MNIHDAKRKAKMEKYKNYVFQLIRFGGKEYVLILEDEAIAFCWPYCGTPYLDHTAYFLERVLGSKQEADEVLNGGQVSKVMKPETFAFVSSKEYHRIAATSGFWRRVINFFKKGR